MSDKVVVSGDANLRNIIDGQPNAIYEKSINEHDKLTHRDYADQHPISAITGLTEELERIEGEIPVVPEVPTKLSDLQNDVGFITTESDPSVPAWAKEPTKPSYTAEEVGALPDDTVIPAVPTNVSAFTNDAGYLTQHQDISGKQDVIPDLAAIRAGAALGATAVQTETDPTVPAWAKSANKPTYTAAEVGALPDDTEIPVVPTDVSAFNNDAGYLTSYTETDPTVPAWAKASSKPTYTAQEVGALPDDTVIPTVPTEVSAFTNDAGYITGYTETDPTVPSWAKAANKPTYTASEVGALPSTYTPPVTSVNGQTGAVVLSIPTVPTAVSSFTNDAGYITLADLPVYDGRVV